LFDSRCIICGNPKKKNGKCSKCAKAHNDTIKDLIENNPSYIVKGDKIYG